MLNGMNKMKAEVSFDLVMEDNMGFVEGTYRLPGHEWQVFIFSSYAIQQLVIHPNAKWSSGITGVHVRFPESENLNRERVLRILSDALGVTEWNEVRGPDSMQLR